MILPVTVEAAVTCPRKTPRYRRCDNLMKPFMDTNWCEEKLKNLLYWLESINKYFYPRNDTCTDGSVHS